MGRGTQTAPAVRVALPRRLAAHPTWAAAGLFALLLLAYLWPALLGLKALSADGVLYSFAPWHAHSPEAVAAFRNTMLTDVPLVVRPWHQLVRLLLHEGALPLW